MTGSSMGGWIGTLTFHLSQEGVDN
jgi:hypothetical protein